MEKDRIILNDLKPSRSHLKRRMFEKTFYLWKSVKDIASNHLKLVKRLASTQSGADKNTQQLYLGYIRSNMEYSLAL